MIEDFPRAEVDLVGREDVAFCAADDLALLGGGRVVCTLDDLRRGSGGS